MTIAPEITQAFCPTGRLRASINLGNPILASRAADGSAQGVSVDLARGFAQRLGVELDLVVFDTAAASVDAGPDPVMAALAELESVQALVNPASRPDCLRSQYLLGSLYRDLGRETDAQQTFQKFLANTAGSTDAETKALRKSLNAK